MEPGEAFWIGYGLGLATMWLLWAVITWMTRDLVETLDRAAERLEEETSRPAPAQNWMLAVLTYPWRGNR